MKEKTRKLVMWVSLIAAVLGGIFAMVHATGSDAKHVLDGMRELDNPYSGMFDIAYWITVAMFVIAICAIVYFSIANLLKNFKDNPKKARTSLIIVAVAVVVVLIAYLCSSGTDVSAANLEKYGVTEGASKWIGAGCITVYIMAIAAVVAIVWAEISKAIKK